MQGMCRKVQTEQGIREDDSMNIAYRITAVPERLDNAMNQAKSIGFGDIYLDKNHNGNIWNKFRVYKDIIADGSYSHVCMNDDDLIMPMNFTDAVECLVQRFPDCIFTFYNSKIGSNIPRIIRLRNHYMNGASCVIPTKYLSGFLDFYENNLQGFKWDDTSMSIYALLNDIDVLLPCPKLIDVVRMQSTLPMRRGRYQPCNHGLVYDKLINIEELSNASVIDSRKIRLNTHLAKDNPIAILCENKLMEE